MSQETIDRILTALRRREPIDIPVAVIVAHPDDETIGAGASLCLFRRLTLIHVTDGAPADLWDARAAGFATSADYAAARSRELRAAMTTGQCLAREAAACGAATGKDAGDRVKPGRDAEERPVRAPAGTRRRPRLPIPDQTAALHLPWLAAMLRSRLQESQAVLTHAYEGGHPDHDAIAFAVQAAGVPTIEMAGYHAAPNGSIATGRFLPNGEPTIVPLAPGERARRDAMLACFATQRATLEPFFGQTEERFRPAPRYDFTRAAAPRTYYDRFAWGMTSERWCALATEATRC